MSTRDHGTHIHQVEQDPTYGELEQWGEYISLELAAIAIKSSIAEWKEEDMRAQAELLANALQAHGETPEGYELKWYHDLSELGDQQNVAYNIGLQDPGLTLGDLMMACWSAYVEPLMPEGEDSDEGFPHPAPVILKTEQWKLLESELPAWAGCIP